MNDLFGNLFSVGGDDLFDTVSGNLFSIDPVEPTTGAVFLLLGSAGKLLGASGNVLGAVVEEGA